VSRRPFQGTWNIVRFNWPFYVLSAAIVFLLLIIRSYLTGLSFHSAIDILLVLTVLPTLVSLIVSWYVYDHSNLYSLDWLDDLPCNKTDRIVNINAGFDETSSLLADKFPGIEITACDFYDPSKHTAPSIKRARSAYPPLPHTRKVSTDAITLDERPVDKIFAIMSAHEIRDRKEREIFFRELSRLIASNGQIVVVEHVRNMANMLAYNAGALHFHTRPEWLKAFSSAQLRVDREIKITPFITAFFLSKDGNTS